VATAQNLKNSKVAIVRFGQIKRKLHWENLDQSGAPVGAGSSSSQISPQKPASAKKARAPKAKQSKDEFETPVKKRKTLSGKIEIHEDNEDGGNTNQLKKGESDAEDNRFDAQDYYDADD
jgi:hypothetical protein